MRTVREDGVHVVEPKYWKLADGSAPKMFLQREALEKKTARRYELKIHERFDEAAQAKEHAKASFVAKAFAGAAEQ